MKDLLIGIIVLIVLSMVSFKSYGQENFIIAGTVEGVLYTDIQDTLLTTEMGWYLGDFVYEFDMDMDDEFDFKIFAHHSEGISHNISYIKIQPYGNNKVAFSDSIPAINGQDTVFYVNRAGGVNTGDTISDDIHFINEGIVLDIENVVVLTSISFNWGNWGYIPVCLATENDQSFLYGWIKVSGVTEHQITIESFALEIYTSSIEKQMLEEKIIIYPNPSSNYISIKTLHQGMDVTMEAYNNFGQKQNVFFDKTNKEYVISIEHLPSGIYLLKLKSKNEIYIEKFIKK